MMNAFHFGRRTWKRASLFLAAFFSLYLSLQAGLNTGADFLKIPIGAEPAALGQAYTAMASGINSLNWNPAGIAKTPASLDVPTLGLSLSRQNQFSENNLDHLAVVVPAGRNSRSSWGLDLIRMSYADQESRDANRQVSGSVDASDMALGAAMAHDFGAVQGGAQVKFIRMELAGAQADGIAMDLGFLSRTPSPLWTMGFAVRNLGPRMRFVSDSFNLPLTLSLGTAFRVTNPLTLALDVHHKPHSRQTVVAIGSEIVASKNISLRAGYLAKVAESINNHQESETNRGNFGGVGGFAGGFGLSFRQFNMDYSITPFGELGNAQMLTLSTWFGQSKSKAPDYFAQPIAEPAMVQEAQATLNDRLILILPISEKKWWGRSDVYLP